MIMPNADERRSFEDFSSRVTNSGPEGVRNPVAGKHLPERFIQLAAAALFLAFGVGMLVGGIFPAAPVPVLVGSAVAVVALFTVVLRALPQRLRPAATRAERAPLTVSVEPGSDEVPDGRHRSGVDGTERVRTTQVD
jgi:hypothetical protein